MDQYEDLQKRQVTEFKTAEQTQQQQQQQQMNPFLQKAMMDQTMENQQQSKGTLQKDREKVAENMPETLQEQKDKEKKKTQPATPFSLEITKQLQVIIRDKENASAYYQPILKLSRALLKPDLTEEAKVSLFQELMVSMTFYLNHHAETETASLADRRRALCRRTIKGAMLFVAQAPEEYTFALKDGIQKLSGSEKEAIVNMDAKELRKGFLEFLDEATEENPDDDRAPSGGQPGKR